MIQAVTIANMAQSTDPNKFQIDKRTPVRLVGLAFWCTVATVTTITVWKSVVLFWPFRFHVAALIALVEAVFYFAWFRRRYKELNTPPEVHAPNKVEAEILWGRFIHLLQTFPDEVKIEDYLSVWFRGAEYSNILRENVEELVAYGFWYKTRWVLVLQSDHQLVMQP